jgi:hypothetical protein
MSIDIRRILTIANNVFWMDADSVTFSNTNSNYFARLNDSGNEATGVHILHNTMVGTGAARTAATFFFTAENNRLSQIEVANNIVADVGAFIRNGTDGVPATGIRMLTRANRISGVPLIYSQQNPALALSDIETMNADGTELRFDTGSGENVEADCAFVDAAAGDFHLLPTSPCIDVALDDPASPAFDVGGVARPSGGGADVGAFEVGP